MTKKAKAKPMTFRRRLRADAEKKLDSMLNTVWILACEAVKADGSATKPADLMRLLSSGQTKSLRNRLVTKLANEKVAELERIYNNQQELPLKVEESGGDDAS